MRITFTKNLLFKALILFIATGCLWSCKKNDPKPAATPVSVISLSVNSGPYNTVVVINGSGFDGAIANDKVYFNGTEATVSAATTTQLTVRVPTGATSGNVTVSVNNGSAANGPVFTITTPVTILSLNTTYGPYNTPVIIKGTGFSVNPSNDQVYFNGKQATISSATATQLNVIVPLSAGTGNVTVSVDNAAPVSGPVFNYVLTATVSTFAGRRPYQVGSTDGTGTQASFSNPYEIVTDASGYMYVADKSNNKIRKISPDGVVTTFAGNGTAGAINGPANQASFNGPEGIAVDANGNVYVADSQNHLIRKITATGIVSTLAGSGIAGLTNGTGSTASFNIPTGLAVDAQGNIYVTEYINNDIRKISSAGIVTTFAGNGSFGSADGKGALASFSAPYGVTVDNAGNVYVADFGNNLIRKVTADGVVTTIAGNKTQGELDGSGSSAIFDGPSAIVIDATGNLYVTDMGGGTVRKVTPNGGVATIAGPPGGAFGGSADGPARSASFAYPFGITLDANGNFYIADTGNNLIRKLSFE